MSKEDYYLETWNNTNATRTGQLVLVDEPRIVYEMEGENTLTFKLSEKDSFYSVYYVFHNLTHDQGKEIWVLALCSV